MFDMDPGVRESERSESGGESEIETTQCLP